MFHRTLQKRRRIQIRTVRFWGVFPPEILVVISEFIGPHNPLFRLNKHTRYCLTKLRPMNHFAEKVSGIKGIIGCQLIEPDYNNLLMLPRISYAEDSFNYFVYEMLNGKYRSVQGPILAHIVRIYSQLNSTTMARLNTLFFRVLFDFNDTAKISSIIHATIPESIRIFPYMNLEMAFRLSAAFPVVSDSTDLFTAEFMKSPHKLQLIPYLIVVNGADQDFWMSNYDGFDSQAKAAFFYQLIDECLFVPGLEAIERLESVMRRYFPIETHGNTVEVILIDAYVKAFKGTVSNFELLRLISRRGITDDHFGSFALMMSRIGRSHLVPEILGGQHKKIFGYTDRLFKMSSHALKFLNTNEYAVRIVKDLIALAPVGRTNPLWLLKDIYQVFFVFYEVQSASFSREIVLNCTPVSTVNGELTLMSSNFKMTLTQVFTEPISITLNSSQVSDLIRTINTRNTRVLGDLLEKSNSGNVQIDYRLGEISPSFLIGCQISDEFGPKFWKWCKAQRLGDQFKCGMNCLVPCLDYPVDNIIGKVEIDYHGFQVLDKKEQFINLMRLSGKSFADICSVVSFKSLNWSQIAIMRPFLAFWIESEEWQSLATIENKLILDYLAIDYPRKISKIRRIKKKNNRFRRR